jgi:hypothetical protein
MLTVEEICAEPKLNAVIGGEDVSFRTQHNCNTPARQPPRMKLERSLEQARRNAHAEKGER